MPSLTDRYLAALLATMRRKSPVPPSAGPWNNNPSWGNAQVGLVPPTASFVTSVATLDRTYGPPQVTTVALSRQPGRFVNASNYDFKARVTWSVGAISRNLQMDWRDGAQFSIVASTIKVESITEVIDLSNAYDNGGHRIDLGACFAAGDCNAPAPQYSTGWYTLAGGGSSVTIATPGFADAWLLQGGSVANPLFDANTVVQVCGPVLLPFAEYTGLQLGPTDQDFIRFASGLEQLNVINNAATPINFKVVYRLAL